ncbi:hypothetical protein BJX64DRAFT_299102 [Aspergillus heterothallicus]
MAPPSADTFPITTGDESPAKSTSASRLSGPLKYSGSLDEYESFDLTPVIGREFSSTLQLSEILHDDAKIRDLGTIVSQRGVVFLRNQDLNISDQKSLAIKIGHLTGRPQASYLHKHPLSNGKRRLVVGSDGKVDDEVTIMSSEQNKKMYKGRCGSISFEPVPSDYAILKIVTLPEDTALLFAAGFQIRAGWIDEVTDYESEMLKSYFLKLISENHDLQVRFRWSENDIAIWDNRSVFHTAVYDYNGTRVGNRVVSLGERPIYDPDSTSRREALGLKA